MDGLGRWLECRACWICDWITEPAGPHCIYIVCIIMVFPPSPSAAWEQKAIRSIDYWEYLCQIIHRIT